VVDTSGSMSDASKLPKAQTALVSFISNIRGKNDRLGVVEFADRIKFNSGLKPVTQDYKDSLTASVRGMTASGNTGVYDGVLTAFELLQAQGDAGTINAIVVMTDGKENASRRTDLNKLKAALTSAKVPVVVFSIAFGKDADTNDMKTLAEVTKGQFRQADTLNIDDLYKIISTYF
jgi:Ca-activated chloride channel homolog